MRRKIEIKKIEEPTKRVVTFSKRRSSLLKKAEEIAICCDVDVLFVMLSPSGRLNKFSSKKRIEDMLQRYIKLPVQRRLTHVDNVQEKVEKLRQLNHIKGDASKLLFLDKQIENLELQIKKSTLELQIVDANIRDYEPGPEQKLSLYQLCWCERNLQLSLQKVMTRKMELEKQGKMDVHFAAQQIVPQRFDINNWIDPYSSSIQGSINQDWMDNGKRVANTSYNYTYIPSFASSLQTGNVPFSQLQNPSAYIPWQSKQQNMIADVQQNQEQTFGRSQNMMVDVQQNQAQKFGEPQAQVTFGENSDNSIMNFWQNIFASTRTTSPLVTTDTQLNNPSQLGLEYAHSNLNSNTNNNINIIIQQNDHSSVQSDAIAPRANEYTYSMEENTMGNNEFLAETTYENDSWEWDDISLIEALISIEKNLET